MGSVNIVLADSSDLIRIGLRALLSRSPKIQIAGEATSNQELLDQVKSFHPDVVVIDYTSENFSIDVIPRIVLLDKNVKFVAITKANSSQTIVDALRSGVTSHIKKDCSAGEIIESVEETAAGNKFFCGQILEKIREEKIKVDDIEFEELSCEPISLSQRELEVIALIAEGHTNGVIATKLFLSAHTVNTHRKNIMKKLGVNNTAGIVMYAVKAQIVSPNKFLFAAQQEV